jgi:hypothetical protein
MTALPSIIFEQGSRTSIVSLRTGLGIVVPLDLLLPAKGSRCGHCERV